MPATEILIAFTAAALLMNISPGPSNFYVMARAIAQGPKGGVIAALGLALGSLVHVVATVLGLAALFKHSPALFTAVKLIGAGYLVFLGIRYWRSAAIATGAKPVAMANKPLTAVFTESVIVEVTNPKTALFFLALLPQFVVADSAPVALQLLVLGIIVTLSALPCDLLVAFSSSKIAIWLAMHEPAQRIQQRLAGSILLALGVFIIANEVEKR